MMTLDRPDPPSGRAISSPACPSCGSENVRAELCTSGPHFATVACLDCGRQWWGKAPWSLERARAFTMTFGRHRGWTLGELAGAGFGDYLRWMAENVRGNPGIAAAIVLGIRGETGGTDRSSLEPDQAPCSDSTFRQKRNPGLAAGTSSSARDLTSPSGGTDLNSTGGLSSDPI
jgi:hypothetical protein